MNDFVYEGDFEVSIKEGGEVVLKKVGGEDGNPLEAKIKEVICGLAKEGKLERYEE